MEIFASFIITVYKKFANKSQACKLNFIERKRLHIHVPLYEIFTLQAVMIIFMTTF